VGLICLFAFRLKPPGIFQALHPENKEFFCGSLHRGTHNLQITPPWWDDTKQHILD